jgi:hypothetical protein
MADLYVRATGGNDSNDGSTFALAKATLQAAFDAILAGNTLKICGDDSSNIFTLSATVDVDMNAGANPSPTPSTMIKILACDMSTGAPYAGSGKVEITTTSTLANGLLQIGAAPYFEWQDFLFNGGGSGKGSYCVYCTNNGAYRHRWIRCRATNAGSHGFYVRAEGAYEWDFVLCEIDNNGKGGTGWGIYSSSTTRAAFAFTSCSIHNNHDSGVYLGSSVTIIRNSKIYKNGGHGIHFSGANHFYLSNTVVFGNTLNGIEITFGATTNLMITNTIFRSNGGYAIDTNGGNSDQLTYCDYNCFHNNTSGSIDIDGGTPKGSSNVLSDPLFTSETAGSEDFTLQASSPCKNAGMGIA